MFKFYVWKQESFWWLPWNGAYLGKDTSNWPGFQASYCLNLQLVLCKRLTLSPALIFVTEGLFIYIYFLLFEENHQNRISRAGEKFLQRFLSFSVKWLLKLKFSCVRRLKDWTSVWYNSESSNLAGSKLASFHVCLHSFQCTPDQNNRFGKKCIRWKDLLLIWNSHLCQCFWFYQLGLCSVSCTANEYSIYHCCIMIKNFSI